MNIQTFIFNWRGQYQNTLQKIEQLRSLGIKPEIINSDDNHINLDWHNIGEHSYFTNQMLKALELFDASKSDALFHIQADASFDKWEDIYNSAEMYLDKYKWGIYAPNVDHTYHKAHRVDIDGFKIPEENLKLVSNTDCTCWIIHKDIINEVAKRNINFKPYKIGWGIDVTYSALSHMTKRPVLRDYRFTIDHPAGTNYSAAQGTQEQRALHESLPDDIKLAFSYISSGDRNMLLQYYSK